MGSRETLHRESFARKGLSVAVQVAWVAFSLLVLYVVLYPFIVFLFAGKELVFPYYPKYMPTFRPESVSSFQYFLSLWFMHLGYAGLIVFAYSIKKMLQQGIAGRFFTHDNEKMIIMAALSLAYLVVCPGSIEVPLYFQEITYAEWIQILLSYLMVWIGIGVITFLGIRAMNYVSRVREEQRLTI
jgi:hypothetical protein